MFTVYCLLAYDTLLVSLKYYSSLMMATVGGQNM